MLCQPPFPVYPLASIGCRYPVIDGARNDANRMGRFSLFPDRDQKLCAMTLLGVRERLDLVEGRFIEMDMLAKGSHISRLLADDFGRRVLDDASAILIRLLGSPNKVFRGLADAPYAGVALSGSAKELHDHACEDLPCSPKPGTSRYER